MANKSPATEEPKASRPTAATDDGSAASTRPNRNPTQAAAAVEKQRARLAAAIEDPDEQTWQRAARAAVLAHNAELEEWQRGIDAARNRAERRALGKPPRLQLPPHADFNERKSDAVQGPVFGRFVVTGQPGQELAHDVYRAAPECRVDEELPRTFVHYRDELAQHYPDAELHPACFAPSP